MSAQPDLALSASAKTLIVLEAAITHSRFTDIVDKTGFAKATTHRILATLVQFGYLVVDRDGAYLPGPKALLIGGHAMADVDISSVAGTVVEALVESTGCTVHVAIRIQDSAVYLLRRDSRKPYRMNSTVGASLPLYMCGLGKAILGWETEPDILAHAQRTGLTARTPRTITDVDELLADLALTRARGYALDDEENDPGVRCVAAPIRDQSGEVAYAISVSTLSLEHTMADLEAMAPDVIEAAGRISAALGNANR